MIVWLASYPRSGNTFLRVVLNSIFGLKTYSIYDDINDIAADRQTANIVGHEQLPADFDIDKARNEDDLYLIKTHDHPVNDVDKTIYLVRDGREVVLSYLKYEHAFRAPNTTLLDVIYGNVPFGSWARHLEKWDPKHRKNTLLIRFEDLVDNPTDMAGMISDFIGVEPTSEHVPSFEELHQINPLFFKSGKKDSWKSVFSSDEQAAFMLRHYSALVEHGYDNDLPEMFLHREDTTLFRQLSREVEYLQNTVFTTLSQQLEQKNLVTRNQDEMLARQASRIDSLERTLAEGDARAEELHSRLDVTREQLSKTREQLKDREDKIQSADRELENVRQSARHLLEELQMIRNSRRYMLAERLAGTYNRLRRKLSR